MKPLLQFMRTTLVGGILFPVLIIVLVIILGRALAVAHRLIDPLAARLSTRQPDMSFEAGQPAREIATRATATPSHRHRVYWPKVQYPRACALARLW